MFLNFALSFTKTKADNLENYFSKVLNVLYKMQKRLNLM